VIDWLQVFRNALWIAGLAVVLTAWSYYHWTATVTGEARPIVFGRRGWIASRTAGLVMFASGQAMLPSSWYLHAAWALLAIWAVADGVKRWRAIE
jgi:hypothetical protein